MDYTLIIVTENFVYKIDIDKREDPPVCTLRRSTSESSPSTLSKSFCESKTPIVEIQCRGPVSYTETLFFCVVRLCMVYVVFFIRISFTFHSGPRI